MRLPEEIDAFLRSHGLKLNTNLGQHFLTDEEVLATIIESAGIVEDDDILEIGPGIGVLTRELLKHARTVTAIELDHRLIPLLELFTKGIRHDRPDVLRIIEGNALAVGFPSTPYKIVANIPYHITSPLLRHAFLESSVRPKSLTLLIQREVAQKICDTENAGMLTILVALFGTPIFIRRVPPACFLPPPAVDSAVLHIESHAEPLADSATIERIFRLTKLAFGQKRKMLRNSLGKQPGGMELLAKIGIEAQRRPETITIQEWIALAKTFQD
jgi:16S rRNA (adenine1518-N6/adenine1519-N6)-dimethyltransferase